MHGRAENGRVCPLCARTIPVYRALCSDCFRLVPWEMRADVLRAYQQRVRNWAGWQEALAELLIWNKGRDARPDGEKDL